MSVASRSGQRRKASPFGADRSAICDSKGRHIPVVERTIVHAEEVQAVRVGPPRNGRELAGRLDALSGKVRRLMPNAAAPERFHEDRSEVARELQRLSEWAADL